MARIADAAYCHGCSVICLSVGHIGESPKTAEPIIKDAVFVVDRDWPKEPTVYGGGFPSNGKWHFFVGGGESYWDMATCSAVDYSGEVPGTW